MFYAVLTDTLKEAEKEKGKEPAPGARNRTGLFPVKRPGVGPAMGHQVFGGGDEKAAPQDQSENGGRSRHSAYERMLRRKEWVACCPSMGEY